MEAKSPMRSQRADYSSNVGANGIASTLANRKFSAGSPGASSLATFRTAATASAFTSTPNTVGMTLQEQFGQIDIYLFDQILRGNISPGMRVLDAGCGGGRNIQYLLREGYEPSTRHRRRPPGTW